jgi:hypothetical protein
MSTEPLEINSSTVDESPVSIAWANSSSELIRETHNVNDVRGGVQDINSVPLMYRIFDFEILIVRCAIGAIVACAVSKRACWNRHNNWPLEWCIFAAYLMNDECPILVTRAHHRPTFSARRAARRRCR